MRDVKSVIIVRQPASGGRQELHFETGLSNRSVDLTTIWSNDATHQATISIGFEDLTAVIAQLQALAIMNPSDVDLADFYGVKGR